MTITALSLPGAFLLTSPVHADARGWFREWFQRAPFADAGFTFDVQQANVSFSVRNVVRGLHYSLAPEGQAKVVTCVAGTLNEIIVDVRVGSPTFGKYEQLSLSGDDGRAVLVPVGVAHGFSVMSEFAVMTYLLSSPFAPALELEINPFDPALAVPWELVGPAVISPKDADAPTLDERRRAGQLPAFAPYKRRIVKVRF